MAHRNIIETSNKIIMQIVRVDKYLKFSYCTKVETDGSISPVSMGKLFCLIITECVVLID